MRRWVPGGFTLVEVLVAMFVLAVGAFGAATTQAQVARLRGQAALESEAVQLAASLAARMHANPAQMALPDAANPYLQLDYDAAAGEPAAPPASTNIATSTSTSVKPPEKHRRTATSTGCTRGNSRELRRYQRTLARR